MKAMMSMLRELITDPTSTDVDDGPLSQMLLNSHSPVVLSCLDKGEMMFADIVSAVAPEKGGVERHTRLRPVKREDQGEIFSPGENGAVNSFDVHRYLESAQPEA
jgi:hypothetical protein